MEKDNSRSYKSFKNLDCWKACTEVRQFISKLVKKYPSEEKFRLVDDIIRASRSSTHNIAEGFGRFHYKENIQFCRHSRGSLHELKDQLICSLDEGYIIQSEFDQGIELINTALALLNGYINYLSKRKQQLTNNI